MAVRMMICFARSGGTVLNQCLGRLPGVVICSEVNPLGGGAGRGPVSHRTIRAQARAWYGIELAADEADFAGSALELESACEATGRRLVLRDWSWAGFMPIAENGGRPPRRLIALEALAGRARVLPFAFVRDAIDVLLSSRKFSTMASDDLETFAGAYLAYVEAIRAAGLPVFRYEDFTRDPEEALRGICRAAELPFHRGYRDYASFDKVNGDVQFGRGSRGARRGGIRPLPRRRVSAAEAAAIDACAPLAAANRQLGYPERYGDRPAASKASMSLDRFVLGTRNLADAVRRAAARIAGP